MEYYTRLFAGMTRALSPDFHGRRSLEAFASPAKTEVRRDTHLEA